MHAVIRQYSGPGAKTLFDILEERKPDVEKVLRGVPGFRAYTLMRGRDGGVSVTVCADKAGSTASVQAAADWVEANAPDTGAGAPRIVSGSVIMQLD